MEKKTKEERVERFNIRKVESEMLRIREDLYVWALQNVETVAEVYDHLEGISGLEELGDRQLDILEPLISIAAVIDDATDTMPDAEPLLSRIDAALASEFAVVPRKITEKCPMR
jgi:hypothetical protein